MTIYRWQVMVMYMLQALMWVWTCLRQMIRMDDTHLSTTKVRFLLTNDAQVLI